MGSSFYVYVGPYLKCKNSPTTVTRDVFGCPNEECARHAEELRNAMRETPQFCARCGTALCDLEVESPDGWTVDVEDLLFSKLNERLVTFNEEYGPEGVDFWVSNQGKSPGKRYDRHSPGVDEHNPDPTQEIAAFTKTHKQDITKLKKAYGEENVEILWGVMTEYN